MLRKDNRTFWGHLEPADEKTPTSMYWPDVAHSAPDHTNSRQAGKSSDCPRSTHGQASSAHVPSVVIAQEILLDAGYDGVADTVAMVRLRHSSALAIVLVVGLSGLFAVTLGILLADFAHCRCSMWRHDLPQNAPSSTSLNWAQTRPRTLAHP
jgi:hypothetical protein